MTTTTLTAAPDHCSATPPGGAIEEINATGPPAGSEYWVDPGTDQVYPLAYRAYRQAREAEEKTPALHRTLGPDVDYDVWRRGRSLGASEAEVSLIVRPNAPLRIRRMVAEVLRSIRRGQPPADAIRHVSRRFRRSGTTCARTTHAGDRRRHLPMQFVATIRFAEWR